MKHYLLAATFMIANVAFANNPGMFIGRYTIAADERCAMGVDATRAYISLETTHVGMKMMTVQAFGLESRMDLFSVENSLAPSMGSTGGERFFDRTRVTWPANQTMLVTINTENARSEVLYTTSYRLRLQGRRLTMTERHSGNPGRTSVCRLTKR